MDYIFLNDAVIKKEKAFLHVSDLSIHRGFGIFDFFKLKERENPWIEHYLNRFYNSLKFAHIPFKYSRSELKSMMIDLFDKNGLETGYIKLVCTGGYSPDGYSPPDESNFMMFTFPLSIFPNKPEGEGYNLITTEFIRPNPIVKSTNYFNSVMHFARMKEYSRCNIYMPSTCSTTSMENCRSAQGAIFTLSKTALLILLIVEYWRESHVFAFWN